MESSRVVLTREMRYQGRQAIIFRERAKQDALLRRLAVFGAPTFKGLRFTTPSHQLLGCLLFLTAVASVGETAEAPDASYPEFPIGKTVANNTVPAATLLYESVVIPAQGELVDAEGIYEPTVTIRMI